MSPEGNGKLIPSGGAFVLSPFKKERLPPVTLSAKAGDLIERRSRDPGSDVLIERGVAENFRFRRLDKKACELLKVW